MGLVSDFLISNSHKTGIDIDSSNEFNFLKSYFNAKHIFPNNPIRIFRSSGGHGYHIEIVGVPSRLSIRRCLGDCLDRCSYSELRSKNKDNRDELVFGDPIVDDVLFSIKTMKIDGRVYRQMREELDEKSIVARRFW